MSEKVGRTARLAGGMPSLRLCALAFLLVVAVPPASAQDPPLVRLALVDLYGLTPEVAASAAAESAAVLDRLGARTEVRWKAPSDPDDPRDLRVVLMPGDPGRLLKRTVMGAVQRGAPTLTLWVFPRTVATVLGLPAEEAGSRTPEERAVFARAFARVVAHEVVHLTCPWREHDASGLMAAHMSQATLRGLSFEPEASLRRDFVLGAAIQTDRSLPVARGSALSTDAKSMARLRLRAHP
jgi:hypothetical protein